MPLPLETSIQQHLPATSPHVERRVSVRQLCDLEAMSRPDVVPEELVWEARVRDLGSGGLGLWLDRPFPSGTMLAIDLPDRSPSLLARVVHATAQDDGWLHGCEFARRLTNDEVQALL